MNEKLKRVLLLLEIFIIGIMICTKVGASNETDDNLEFSNVKELPSATALSSGYIIENYDIDVVVNENNTFNITERIKVNFLTNKHGIFRKIPVKNNVKRIDGTTSNNKAKITNISVNEDYNLLSEKGYKVIKIGSSERTITGEHSYLIKYTYDIGKDPLKDADELYFNLIGTEWDTEIQAVTFRIQMPKEFDESTLGFSSGYYGSVNSYNVKWDVDGKVITGKTISKLNVGEALTVRLTLPEGYFVHKNDINIYSIVIIAICGVFVLLADRLWSKFGKEKQIVETVEFYPPEECNSAEVQLLYKGKADEKGVLSLLIYLANKGYIKIEEEATEDLKNKKKQFKFTKLKEYDGNNETEREFMDGLFDKDKNTASLNVLFYRFGMTVQKIKNMLNEEENQKRIFDYPSKIIKILFGIIMTIIFAIIQSSFFVNMERQTATIAVAIETFLNIPAFITFLVLILEMNKAKKKTSRYFGALLILCAGSLVTWAICIQSMFQVNAIDIIMYLIGMISIVAVSGFMLLMRKRTPYGTEMLGKIRGFKRFLETVEKPQLESLVEENPEYFYNILPYTYALGVSDKWIKQFEGLAMQIPTWYDSSNSYKLENWYDLTSYMEDRIVEYKKAESIQNELMHASRSRINYDSNYSSYDNYNDFNDSSGGGFSGGGSGGGGGGSW